MKKIFTVLVFVFVVSVVFATTIYDIQYTTEAGPDGTYPSPMVDEDVTITGIVTGNGYYSSGNDNRFFVSDPDGGAWNGIFVFNFDTIVEIGDEVEIAATVTEYYGFTELGYCTITILSSGNPVPDPIPITTLNLAVPAQAEMYEGCLVEITNVTVTEEQDEYGQWYVDDDSGECQVDDSIFKLEDVVPPIVITTGMDWAVIRGCVDYSFDEFGINPRTPDDLIDEVSIIENTVVPTSEFIGCYPNPFNPQTTAFLNLKNDSQVTLNVYNVKGEKIRTLVNENLSVGEHHVVWNGTDNNSNKVSSGIYFFEADVSSDDGDYTSLKKVILLK